MDFTEGIFAETLIQRVPATDIERSLRQGISLCPCFKPRWQRLSMNIILRSSTALKVIIITSKHVLCPHSHPMFLKVLTYKYRQHLIFDQRDVQAQDQRQLVKQSPRASLASFWLLLETSEFLNRLICKCLVPVQLTAKLDCAVSSSIKCNCPSCFKMHSYTHQISGIPTQRN